MLPLGGGGFGDQVPGAAGVAGVAGVAGAAGHAGHFHPHPPDILQDTTGQKVSSKYM